VRYNPWSYVSVPDEVLEQISMNAPPPADARLRCLELEGVIPPDRRHSRRVLGTFAQQHPLVVSASGLMKLLPGVRRVLTDSLRIYRVFHHYLKGRVSSLLGITVPPFTVPLKMKLLYHRLIGDSSPTHSARRFAALFWGEASHHRALTPTCYARMGECRLILFKRVQCSLC